MGIPGLLTASLNSTILPEEVRPALTAEAHVVSDTDWHLDRLYGFAHDAGYSVLKAKVSRYAIDLNRPPSGESLYPGQTTTGLCPRETFKGDALYRPGHEPDATEVARRLDVYWKPYHRALECELQRLLKLHGRVLLWEAHSIASVLPRLFPGRLPDLNFGTNSGAACGAGVMTAVLQALKAAPAGVTHVVNGRFKGGYITRRYGDPACGIHAIQLEMAQSLYMQEERPFHYRHELATKIQPVLKAILAAASVQLKATT